MVQKQNKNPLNNIETAGPLLKRSAVFLVCIAFAAWLIAHHAVTRAVIKHYGFEYYGNIGEALLLGCVTFILLAKRRPTTHRLRPWKLYNFGWLAAAIVALYLNWMIVDNLSIFNPRLITRILAHILIVAIATLLLLFAFGASNLRTLLWKTYRREFLTALLLSLVFAVFLVSLNSLWPYLSSTVLNIDKSMFNSIGITSVYYPPYSLLFNKFSITVGEYCSGIDSIGLFTALYVLIGSLDWNVLNHKKYLSVFPLALVILFGLNILRVFVLILSGYYINPQIAFSVFHTYAGLVFFVIYSAIFWRLSYRWMLNKSALKPNK